MKYSLDTIKLSNKKLPKLLIISGLHGDETNAVFSSMKFKKTLKNESSKDFFSKIYSSITFMIGVNEYGLKNRCRESKSLYDHNDLNRIFYDETDYRKEILDQIDKVDIVIDVHNSPNISNCVLLSYDAYAKTFNESFKRSRIQTIVIEQNNPTIKNFVNLQTDKLGFTIELNGMNSHSTLDENAIFISSVATCVSSIKKKKDLLDFNLLCTNVLSKTEGIIDWNLYPGSFVEKGDIIAEILDFNNIVQETITSPVEGIINVSIDSLFINKNEVLCQISKNNL